MTIGTAYVDTGVTIFDNDPTYNGTVSSNVSSININTVGSYLMEFMLHLIWYE